MTASWVESGRNPRLATDVVTDVDGLPTHTLKITGNITASSASVGTVGAAVPASADQIGWKDGSGNLQAVSAANPLPVSASVTVSESVLNVTGTASSAAVLSNFPVTNTAGYRTAAVQITAITAGNTVVAEESNDGTTWYGIQSIADTTVQSSTPLTAVGKTIFPISMLQFRLRISVFSSGSASANVEFRQSPPSQIAMSMLGALPAGTNIVGKFGIDQTTPGTTNAVAATNFPTTVDTNTGAAGASTLRVAFASSSTVIANAGTNLNTSALALESGGNLATLAGGVSASVYQEKLKQVNGVTVLTGTGAVGTGTQRIAVGTDTATIAGSAPGTAGTASAQVLSVQGIASMTPVQVSQSGTWNIATVTTLTGITPAFAATGGSVQANAVLEGYRAATTNPTAVSDGQLVAGMADKVGRQAVVIGNVRDNKSNTHTALSSSSETTIIAQVASIFLDVYGIIVSNTTGSAVTLTFKDSTGGTTQFSLYVPANDTRGFMLPSSDGFKQTTVNNNWTVTGGANGVNIDALYVKNI